MVQEQLYDYTSISQISVESNSSLQVLQRVFGHHDFRPGQEEAIIHLISGEDTIVLIIIILFYFILHIFYH